MIEKIILNTSGYDSFINMCNLKSISTTDIKTLLETDAYNKAITLMGKNWGLPSKNQWIDYFSVGFNCSDVKKDISSLCPVQKQGAEHISKAIAHINQLASTKNRMVYSVETKEFIKIVSNYVPSDAFPNSLEIIPLVFAPNAGGNESIIMDTLFLSKFTNDEISRILAHELHHILRNKIEVQYIWKDDFKDVGQALFWFESEGIADLCNFNETAKIYSDFGYATPGKINDVLQNISYYINETDTIIVHILEGRKPPKELLSFLSKDVKFHVIGYFLAKTISDTLGNQEIANSVGDPLAFLNLYQKACKMNKTENELAFSNEMMTLLKSAYFK